jgi:hypothetical protein
MESKAVPCQGVLNEMEIPTRSNLQLAIWILSLAIFAVLIAATFYSLVL